MSMKSNKTHSDYKFEDAYDIRDRGIGRLNLDRAVKSEAFIEKVSNLAQKMKKVPLLSEHKS